MFTDLKEDEYSQFSGRTKHLMKYFLCKLRNYFSTIQTFYQRELTQVFEMLRTKSVWVGAERTAAERRRGEANALLHYLWWIDNNNCATLAGSWAKYVKRIAFIDSVYKMHLLWKLICNIKSIFISSPNYLFYLSPLCCAEAVSGLHLYIATLLLLLRGNVLIQGYIVFTSTQMI